jgi:hypothetical protein
VKAKILIGVAIAFLLFRIAGWFCWLGLPPVSSSDKAQSPDGRYAAKVSSSWHGDFWGRFHEYHHILVETAGGQIIRRISIDEACTGWPKDCSIQWATNSSSVTVTFKSEEALKTRVVLDITRLDSDIQEIYKDPHGSFILHTLENKTNR